MMASLTILLFILVTYIFVLAFVHLLRIQLMSSAKNIWSTKKSYYLLSVTIPHITDCDDITTMQQASQYVDVEFLRLTQCVEFRTKRALNPFRRTFWSVQPEVVVLNQEDYDMVNDHWEEQSNES